MTTLFSLTEQYGILQKAIEDNDLPPEDFDIALGLLEGAILIKVENIGIMIKQNEAIIRAVEIEMERIAERKRVREARIDRLRQYLEDNFKTANMGERLEFPLVTVAMQKNPPSVKIINEAEIPASFVRIIPEQKEVNKRAILDSWKKTGENPPGTEIISDKKRLVVK